MFAKKLRPIMNGSSKDFKGMLIAYPVNTRQGQTFSTMKNALAYLSDVDIAQNHWHVVKQPLQ